MVVVSPGGAAAITRKRRSRGPGAKKTEVVLQGLSSEQADLDIEAQISEVTAALRADRDMLNAVRAMIRKKEKTEAPAFIRRSVKDVGEVPHYVVEQALHVILKVDMSVYKNYGDHGQKRMLMLRGLNCKRDHALPHRKMHVTDYLAWVEERYKQQGQLLDAEFDEADMEGEERFDWEVGLGNWAYAVTAEMDDDTVVTKILDRSTGSIHELPNAFWCKVSELGSTFQILENFQRDVAYILQVASGATQPLATWVDAMSSKIQVTKPQTKKRRVAVASLAAGVVVQAGAGATADKKVVESPATKPDTGASSKLSTSGESAVASQSGAKSSATTFRTPQKKAGQKPSPPEDDAGASDEYEAPEDG